jgi:hypothetical protein
MCNDPISDLPPITYTHSARASRLRITIKPTKTITVTIPKHSTRQQAQQFLHSKISWIKKHLQKIDHQRQLQQSLPDLPTIDLDKAQDELFNRLDYFSEKYNLPYNRVKFRCQKTKWGSCSSQNNISLNINIAWLTMELQDYILLHELVHTRIKNHRKKFWAELDRFVDGRAKLLQKELKGCRMRVKARA